MTSVDSYRIKTLRDQGKLTNGNNLSYKRIVWGHINDVEFKFKTSPPAEALIEVTNQCVAKFTDSKFLRYAIDKICETQGSGAGPNGISPKELEDSERWNYVMAVQHHLNAGNYSPEPTRTIEIPKKAKGLTTREVRPLEVQNIGDKMPDRCAFDVLSPVCEQLFLKTSYGSRPNRDYQDALAFVQSYATDHGCNWIVTNDIQAAFDNVVISKLLSAVDTLLGNEEVTQHLRLLVDRGQERGLLTGSPLSPLLLNIYLHVYLDSRWIEDPTAPPLVRYVDDLLIPCTSEAEARACQQRLEKLLADVGMTCKFEPLAAITDIENDIAEWLGTDVSMVAGNVTYSITRERREEIEKRCSLGDQMYDKRELIGILNSVGPVWTEQLDAWLYEQVRLRNLRQPGKYQVSRESYYKAIDGARRRFAEALWKADCTRNRSTAQVIINNSVIG